MLDRDGNVLFVIRHDDVVGLVAKYGGLPDAIIVGAEIITDVVRDGIDTVATFSGELMDIIFGTASDIIDGVSNIGDAVLAGFGKPAEGIFGGESEAVGSTVGGKIPVDDYNSIRSSSVKNPDSDTLTLGKYYDDESSYTVSTGDTSYFDMGDDWALVQNQYQLSDAEMFDYFNLPVLEDALSSEKTIRFSHDPLKDDRF